MRISISVNKLLEIVHLFLRQALNIEGVKSIHVDLRALFGNRSNRIGDSWFVEKIYYRLDEKAILGSYPFGLRNLSESRCWRIASGPS